MILGSWWNCSLCHLLLLGFRDSTKTAVQFDTHVTSEIMKRCQHCSCDSFIVVSHFLYHNEWNLCNPSFVIHLSGKFLITYKWMTLWSIKHTCLLLLKGQCREVRYYVSEAFTLNIWCLDKLFHQTQLGVECWKK